MFRNKARWCALAGLIGTFAVAVPASSAPAVQLPRCHPHRASQAAPTARPNLRTANACQADPGRTPESGMSPDGFRGAAPDGGYHHLGAGTATTWGGVSGRMSVVDTSVRSGTYDFVASRFMAKRDMGNGRIAWLEAGWAETGWSGAGRQRIYTFNTNTNTWQFYDAYALHAGDRFWLDLRSNANGLWQAWLWWDNRWNLLTAQQLPIGPSAAIEQYVEVYADPRRPAPIAVPQITTDNVQLRSATTGAMRYWRDGVPTAVGDMTVQRAGGYCLDWANRYDTWSAGSCTGR